MNTILWSKKHVLEPWVALARCKKHETKTMPIFLVDLDAKMVQNLLAKVIVSFMGRDASMLTVIKDGEKKYYFYEKIINGRIKKIEKIPEELAEKCRKNVKYVKTADIKLFDELKKSHELGGKDKRKYIGGIIYSFLAALKNGWINFEPEFDAFTALKIISKNVELEREQIEGLFSNLSFEAKVGLDRDFRLGIRWDSDFKVSKCKPDICLKFKPLASALKKTFKKRSMPEIYERFLKELVGFIKDDRAWEVELLPRAIKQPVLKQMSKVDEKITRNINGLLGYHAKILVVIKKNESALLCCILDFTGGRLAKLRCVPIKKVGPCFKDGGCAALEKLKLRVEDDEGPTTLALCASVDSINTFLSPSFMNRMWAAAAIKDTLNEIVFVPQTPFIEQLRSMSALDLYLRLLVPFVFE